MPPLVAFGLGSLGFLTAHDYNNFTQDLSDIIRGGQTGESGPPPQCMLYGDFPEKVECSEREVIIL